MAIFSTTVYLLMTILVLHCNSNVAHSVSTLESTSDDFIVRHLHSAIVDKISTENLVYSPVSIRTGLALIYMAAGGQTAEEIHKFLNLGNENKTAFASEYGKFLKATFTKPAKNGPQISMASRLFVDDDVKLVEQFNKTAKENFGCLTERVNFYEGALDEATMWTERQRGSTVKNLLSFEFGSPIGMLANILLFEANWLHAFQKSFTTKYSFHLNTEEKIQVDTMTVDGKFAYADLPHLDATALELPYESSNTSMLIILPNKIQGLKKLETKLKYVDSNDITAKMVPKNVRVLLPKFQIKSLIDLKELLEKIGFSSLFSKNVKLNNIFKHDYSERVTASHHMAFFECNEDGTEEAVASNGKVSQSFEGTPLVFHANRPFIFYVRSKTTVFYAGRVVKF